MVYRRQRRLCIRARSDTQHVSSWFAVGGDGGGSSCATGTKAMVHELLTIQMCRHGFWLLATVGVTLLRFPVWAEVCRLVGLDLARMAL